MTKHDRTPTGPWKFTGTEAIGGNLTSEFRVPWFGDSAWDRATGHTVSLTRNGGSCTDAEWAAKRAEYVTHQRARGYRQVKDEPDAVAFVDR
jgi:hypothetical protein